MIRVYKKGKSAFIQRGLKHKKIGKWFNVKGSIIIQVYRRYKIEYILEKIDKNGDQGL